MRGRQIPMLNRKGQRTSLALLDAAVADLRNNSSDFFSSSCDSRNFKEHDEIVVVMIVMMKEPQGDEARVRDHLPNGMVLLPGPLSKTG